MAQLDSPSDRTAAQPPVARRGALGPLLLLGVTVVLAGVAVLNFPSSSPSPAPLPPRAKPVDRMTRLEQRLAVDEARLARLEQAPPAVTKALSSLSARIGALEIGATAGTSAPVPADLATRLDAYALRSDEVALSARVAKLENQDVAGAVRRSAEALALANLLRASDGAGSFASELHAFSALAPDATGVRDLARFAKGVPTLPMLTSQFPRVADAVLAADRRAHAHGWFARFWVNLSSLVSVRRVGAQDGTDTESRLARASVQLNAGDLDGAIAEVRALDETARDAASSWLADAQARAAVDRDLRALTDRIAATLAESAGTKP